MTARSQATDKQLGLMIILGLFVLAGAGGMLIAPGDLLGAAGFAIAVIAGLALIAVIHLVEA